MRWRPGLFRLFALLCPCRTVSGIYVRARGTWREPTVWRYPLRPLQTAHYGLGCTNLLAFFYRRNKWYTPLSPHPPPSPSPRRRMSTPEAWQQRWPPLGRLAFLTLTCRSWFHRFLHSVSRRWMRRLQHPVPRALFLQLPPLYPLHPFLLRPSASCA